MRKIRLLGGSAKRSLLSSRQWPLIAAVLLSIALPSATTAKVMIGGAFVLRTPNGETVTDQTFHGKWLLVYFGYTSCPDSCPIALTEIAGALAKLGTEADKVEPLFITIDPKHDTPAVIGEYAHAFDARILALTGTSDQVAGAAKAYGVYVQWHDGGSDHQSNLIDHSTYIYLMNPSGGFLQAFGHGARADEIAAAIHANVAQKPEPVGPTAEDPH